MKSRSNPMKNESRTIVSRPGFTLIELLVVIAIIALLISVLLPSLGQARQMARQLVCSTKQRSIAQAQAVYAAGNKDHIAGPNTSGAWGQWKDQRGGGDPYVFDTSPTTPTSTHDWFSPILGDSLGRSNNRARRSWDIFAKHGCPSVRDNMLPWSGSDGADTAQFSSITSSLGWIRTSYLSPASFHYSRQGAPASISKYRPPEADPTSAAADLRYLNANPATLPSNYTPRLDKVGIQLSSKIIVADGSRFLVTAGAYFYDFDFSPAPNVFGNFCASGPIFNASNEYGRSLTNGNNVNVKASFRHARQTINAGFFDGHVSTVTSASAWEDAEMWYPSNSDWNGNAATVESAAKYQYLLSRPVGTRGLP